MLEAGAVIAERYRLVERIGEGGMGEVWRAVRSDDGRTVAIKLIRAEVALESEQAFERFEREARAAASVRHPHVIDVLDHGSAADGTPYLAMEHLTGESLDARIERDDAPTIGEVVAWLSDALEGLAAIHERGIVHRDLKPSNIFLAEVDGAVVPKLLDFGIARQDTSAGGQTALPTLTRTGEALGTPHYMSPEQIRASKTVDYRSDLYSAGVILYEALAGRRPFDGASAPAVIAAIVTRDAPGLASLCPTAPEALVHVVERALAYEPDERFDDARQMREALLAAGRGVDAPVTSRAAPPLAPTARAAAPAPWQSGKLVAPAPGRRDRIAMWRKIFGLTALAATVLGTLAVALLALEPEPSEGGALRPGEGRATATSDPAPVPEPNAEPATIADGAPLAVALAWRGLPVDDRVEPWRFVPTGEGDTLHPERGRVGAELAQDGALVPALMRTTARLNVRAGPELDAEIVRTLPLGTLVVALHGRIGDDESVAGGEGTWSRVVASGEDEGWSASNLLQEVSGCVPDVATALDAVPAERRAVVARTATLSQARVVQGGAPVDAYLVVGRDATRRRTYLSLHRSIDCALSPIGAHTVTGFVEEAFLVNTAADGGATLLVTSWHPNREHDRDGVELWSARLVEEDRVVWETRQPTAEFLPGWRQGTVTGPVYRNQNTRSAGYWPVVVRQPDNTRTYYAFRGGRLVVDGEP